ncbi:MAG: (d)CMP kinase [Candidatus Omnitrophica bacterium]|nr:(d)CMP kinase [Candidatus Omnitrophota bacterium]
MGKKASKPLIIAIDGPAGSGKSTVSKIVAKKLALLYIDTGAMYRALTLKAMRQGIDLEDEDVLVSLARNTKIGLEEKDKLHVLLDGEDVSLAIRTPDVTANVKHIARVPGVRHEMVALQRSIANKDGGAILEGRDIGTVVFPNADYKFYLDASPQERAKRRCKELIESGQIVNESGVKKDILMRDDSDMNRSVGALKKCDDAIFIDTTGLSIDGVTEKILSYICA